MGGEDALIDWLRARLAETGRDHLGDDVALLDGSSARLALTVDQQIESVHFLPGTAPEVVARRLLAVNLSDLAAAGARPTWALLALAAPAGFDHRSFFEALLDAATAHDVELVGGDLARSPHLHAGLTVAGVVEHRALRRDDARPGDALWLGGTVGEAALGLELQRSALADLALDGSTLDGLEDAARRAVARHLQPRPQLELGAWLAREAPRGAAIDVSDGLARDLHRLCRASDVGAVVESDRLPLAPDAVELAAHLGRDAFADALGGGEDYVLLFTLPDETEPALDGCTRIGRIVEGDGVALATRDGRVELPPSGHDHLS